MSKRSGKPNIGKHIVTAALGCLCASCAGEPQSETQAAARPNMEALLADLHGVDSKIAEMAAGNFERGDGNAHALDVFHNSFYDYGAWRDGFGNAPFPDWHGPGWGDFTDVSDFNDFIPFEDGFSDSFYDAPFDDAWDDAPDNES